MIQVVDKASTVKLDEQQLAAVEADPNRPALVLAGAGSGKTRTLTLRVAHLIEHGADPGKIVATTFSRKAADEMKERLAPIIGRDVEKLMVNTIHGLCRFMLIDEGLAYDVITVSEQRKIIEDALSPKQVNWDCGWHYPLYWIRRMKMGLVTPMRSEGPLRQELYGCCAKWQAEDLARKLAWVYRLYETSKEADSKMDFDDMLMWVGQKLRDNVQFRQRWQDRVDYVLVDELQDTSRLSMQILETLAAPENRLFGCADWAQSIYRWNLADPSHNLAGFLGRTSGDLYKIETNYRSTQRIVAVGNKLSTILFPEGQVDFKKELKPRPGAGVGEEVEVVRHDDPYGEAAWVGDTIQSEGFKPGDVYVVYRLNAQSRVIEDELVTRGIPYIVQGSLGFYDRAVIKDVLSYLRLVENENNDDAFRRVANMASVWHKKHYRGFGQAFYRDCTIPGKSLWRGMLEISRKVPQFKRDGIDDLVTLIESLRHEGDHKAAKTIKLIREYCYDEWLRRKEGVAEGDEDTQAFEDLNELQDAALSFKTNKEMLAHVDAILAMKEQQKKDQEIDCVVLSTIHRVKGLERPVVFGIGIVEGVLPHWRSDPSIFPDLSGRDELPVQNTSSVDEERCGAYVLVTRAKERLFLGVPMEWRGRAVMPSRFLAEMGLKAEKVEQMPEKPCQDGSIAVETVAEVDPQLVGVEPDEPAEEF